MNGDVYGDGVNIAARKRSMSAMCLKARSSARAAGCGSPRSSSTGYPATICGRSAGTGRPKTCLLSRPRFPSRSPIGSGGGEGLIQEAGRATAKRKPPENLNAYELYLLGTEKLAQLSPAGIEEAIQLLTRAVELDPGSPAPGSSFTIRTVFWRVSASIPRASGRRLPTPPNAQSRSIPAMPRRTPCSA